MLFLACWVLILLLAVYSTSTQTTPHHIASIMLLYHLPNDALARVCHYLNANAADLLSLYKCFNKSLTRQLLHGGFITAVAYVPRKFGCPRIRIKNKIPTDTSFGAPLDGSIIPSTYFKTAPVILPSKEDWHRTYQLLPKTRHVQILRFAYPHIPPVPLEAHFFTREIKILSVDVNVDMLNQIFAKENQWINLESLRINPRILPRQRGERAQQFPDLSTLCPNLLRFKCRGISFECTNPTRFPLSLTKLDFSTREIAKEDKHYFQKMVNLVSLTIVFTKLKPGFFSRLPDQLERLVVHTTSQYAVPWLKLPHSLTELSYFDCCPENLYFCFQKLPCNLRCLQLFRQPMPIEWLNDPFTVCALPPSLTKLFTKLPFSLHLWKSQVIMSPCIQLNKIAMEKDEDLSSSQMQISHIYSTVGYNEISRLPSSIISLDCHSTRPNDQIGLPIMHLSDFIKITDLSRFTKLAHIGAPLQDSLYLTPLDWPNTIRSLRLNITNPNLTLVFPPLLEALYITTSHRDAKHDLNDICIAASVCPIRVFTLDAGPRVQDPVIFEPPSLPTTLERLVLDTVALCSKSFLHLPATLKELTCCNYTLGKQTRWSNNACNDAEEVIEENECEVYEIPSRVGRAHPYGWRFVGSASNGYYGTTTKSNLEHALMKHPHLSFFTLDSTLNTPVVWNSPRRIRNHTTELYPTYYVNHLSKKRLAPSSAEDLLGELQEDEQDVPALKRVHIYY